MRVVEVQPRPGFKLWLRYSDGAGGEVTWDAGVDLCLDMLYMRLTGKTSEQVFPDWR